MSSASTPVPQPDIFIIHPASPHTHTFILLHGLGSNGPKFGTELLETGISSTGQKLTDIYPGAKLLFPTAKKRRSSAFRRTKLNQWFDIASLDDPSHRRDVQLQGLAESALEIRRVLNQELATIPSHRVVLGGLSQGCAMALSVLLTLEVPLAAFVGLSGWFPFRGEIEERIHPKDTAHDDGNDKDPFSFGEGGEEVEAIDPLVAAINLARDLLSMDPLETSTLQDIQTSLRTPVFLAHGDLVEKIKVSLGQEAVQTLSSLGFETTWKSYPDLGHWYKIPEEIDDILDFLRPRLVQIAESG